ncbi:MAG: DEAD/DEAH box helicase [Anaerolineae bacterium]
MAKRVQTPANRAVRRFSIDQLIDYLTRQSFYRDQIVHMERIPARKARYGRLRRGLPRPLLEALAGIGIRRFYTHQAQAINAAREGHNVVIATSTASGKTLIYNVPVLEAMVSIPHARALYVFPTKALAQDQLRALSELTRGPLSGVRFATYDGDTPKPDRARIRKGAAILLTNPDMLHVGILPNHNLWSHFFANLKYVVIDEAHIYRGVFGSQVANVLRRLRRICRFYGADPQFICCSATIANPKEHVQRLTAAPTRVIDDDGSPSGEKLFVLWNPPFLDEAKTSRRSANMEATNLFVELVKHGRRNIAFVKARKIAELILVYARDRLDKEAPELKPLIHSYRAGYLPQERRRIERDLFDGRLLGVTATNALELGVDIGSLDATVQVGYPGTIASTWQQAGRAGRGVRESLSILIGLNGPLDQYFMRHPDELFGRSHEHALIDPDNVYILEKHLPCAAYELPITTQDERLFGPGFVDAMINLERNRVLEYRRERWYYRGFDYPAQDVSIRSISEGRYRLINQNTGERIEEVESATAFMRIHPGAIYLHQGESFLVKELDQANRVARARPVDVNYYTEPRQINEVRIIDTLDRREASSRGPASRSGRGSARGAGATTAYFGKVAVTEQVIGYRKKQQFTETVLGDEFLDLPPTRFETMAVWWDIPPAVIKAVRRRKLDFLGGIHAAEHAAIGILPLFAMCDRWDIGGLSTPALRRAQDAAHADTQRPQIFIYDAYPGGVGIAEKGYELLTELWQATLEAIRDCLCEAGCPSCIQSPKCGNNNEPLDKQAAIVILQGLLGSRA